MSTPDEPVVTHEPDRHRYVIQVDGRQAGLEAYVDHGKQRIFYHTEVDEAFAGRGLAGTLVAHALADTRNAGLRIVPVCPYVKKWLGSHHDVDDVVDAATDEHLRAVRETA